MKKRGVSLIVLVITIIVIIILAAAVILTINNNNPIEKANYAKEQNDIVVEKEQLTLAVGQAKTNKTLTEGHQAITASDLQLEMDAQVGAGNSTVTGTTVLTVTFLRSGRSYEVGGSAAEKKRALAEVANIGDYVKYNITYTNQEVQLYGKVEKVLDSVATGWRVIYKNKETGVVKLIPAGSPLMEYQQEHMNTLLDLTVASTIANITLQNIKEACAQGNIKFTCHEYCEVDPPFYYIGDKDIQNLFFNGTSIRTATSATDIYGESGLMFLYGYLAGQFRVVYASAFGHEQVDATICIRPVVTLKPNLQCVGSGTAANPYDIYID